MTTSPRRQKCPCGSGRRVKDCCNGRKPVSQSLTFQFNEAKTLTSLSLSAEGAVGLFGAEGELRPQRGDAITMRARSNKPPKILTKLPLGATLTLNEWASLSSYDAVFCIDTNTRTIGDRKVSAAVAMQISNPGGEANPERLLLQPLGGFEFHGADERPENLAWMVFMNAVIHGPDHAPGRRYALVTDSDQGGHTAYNSRETPYVGPLLVPEPFTILYASEEGQSPLNQAIRSCDKEAKAFFRAVESGTLDLADVPALSAGSGPFTHLRFWWFPHRTGVARLAELAVP